LAQNPIAVELAIWFHDAVYDSRASDNEEHSAEVARTQIEQRTGKPALANSVANLVMATKNHDPSLHPDAPLLVDVDLSILGKPADRFQEYERDIRKEYAWVDPAIFSARRAEILEQFLARPRIFSTKPFSGKYENAARENLQNSIRALRQTA
jgi:predicted metal-dependent HD superfamily phosphohydrolase